MGNIDITYEFNQDSLKRFVRGIRNYGNDEVESSRLRSVGDMELAEMLIAAIRQWDGHGEYRIDGPCDAADRMGTCEFVDFNEFMCTLSNWSRTMRLTKVRSIKYSNKPTRGYDD